MGAGIDLAGGDFTNNSNLNCINMYIGIFSGEGIFTNNCTIHIEGTVEGIANIVSTFNNNGFIDIIDLVDTDDFPALVVENEFNNSSCGIVNVQSQHPIIIEDTGVLTNNGIVTTEYTGDNEHNSGTFANNGEVRPSIYSNTGNAITGNAPVDGAVPAIEPLDSSGCGCPSVPTMSEWGLLILALLLMTLGTVYLIQPNTNLIDERE